ncbi:lytic transglycosylase domain-containing protein [Altererythrobacter sp. ZODW24]|uniref:lytic transglycosylase domain-containing protein n=1 Tax=Altererythrobacter sp. ZODW24 TaxID=2185142 RepID=UPI000DF7B319|nr:lytic transglycosylase domain-containing protein [Altererythrobacter sp. ZODW24]
MSSMVNKRFITLAALLTTGLTVSVPLAAQQISAASASEWDQARSSMVARQPGQMAQAIDRWERLTANGNLGFDDYAGFVLAYPGFPREARLRGYAEKALDNEPVTPDRLVAFFDKHPPLTNSARARYALALNSLNRPEAAEEARKAWRSGTMSGPSEAYMVGLFSGRFTMEDHDQRMDALLWDRDAEAARRQINLVSPSKRELFAARLAILSGGEPSSLPSDAIRDPGYVYNRVRDWRGSNQMGSAVSLLQSRPKFAQQPHNPEALLGEMLRAAKATGGARQAQRIAASVDDLFAPNADISTMSYRIRDDYTTLMWLGGTKSLWTLGDAASAAPLFYRYGASARTPQTRSKGFYWAGLAAEKAGDTAGANRYYEMAAEYPQRFYGMLAHEKLGRSLPNLKQVTSAQPTPEERAKLNSAPIASAVSEVARNAPWRTGIWFYRELADQADTPGEHVLVDELARTLGRRDLAVINGEAAAVDGLAGFTPLAFPTLQTPPGSNWTMVHAIARQESQFAQNAISHAGARGLMQLMPGTAREQAGKLGMRYMSANLIDSPSYNIRLGDSYFARMMSYYGGAYPLAIAAYNAGPGNVNKWLRRNGDPRKGGISYVDWIEKIPIFETKNYVQRVVENAVVYENLHPDKAGGGQPKRASQFLAR